MEVWIWQGNLKGRLCDLFCWKGLLFWSCFLFMGQIFIKLFFHYFLAQVQKENISLNLVGLCLYLYK